MPRTNVLSHARRVDPDSVDRDELARLIKVVNKRVSEPQSHLSLVFDDGTKVVVPEQLLLLMIADAQDLLAGHGVVHLATETLLSPGDAAQLLGLSRPYIVRLLDEGKIPSRPLAEGSSYRVIRLADVEAFQATRERRAEGRRRIAEAMEEAGIDY